MSKDPVQRSSRQQFGSKVRIGIQGDSDLRERFSANLSDGGLFVQDDSPPPVGTTVLLEFVLPNDEPLSRVAATVMHSRAAIKPGDPTAGMGLKFTELDDVTTAIAQQFQARMSQRRARAKEAESAAQAKAVDVRPNNQRAPLVAPQGIIAGIDLGTVNTCISIVKDGTPVVLRAPGGYETVPSVVYLDADGELLVGHNARERMILEPHRAIYGSKRFMGRPFHSKQVRTLGHFFAYELVAGPDGRTAARIGDRVMPLVDVAGEILARIKEIGSVAAGEPIGRAVVTVPAYFGEDQRQAVRDAGRYAGIHVERVLNEPTAAAVAYGAGRGLNETVLVYDLGGGTFDVSVLRIEGDHFEVLASDGDPFLGGADFDDRLTEYILMTFERSEGVDLRKDAVAVQRVRFAAEMAKHQLTEAETAGLDLPFVSMQESGPVDLRMNVERGTFEALTGDLVERTLAITQGVLDSAKLKGTDLDDVILVGGQSRSPHVRRALAERFGRTPSKRVHPDEAVAMGAAYIGDSFDKEDQLNLTDVLSGSIRLGLKEGKTAPLLPRGSSLPAEHVFVVNLINDPARGNKIMLYRGEGEMADDNTLLGAVFLPGVSANATNRKAQVRVGVSEDGILNVTATHPEKGDLEGLEVLLL